MPAPFSKWYLWGNILIRNYQRKKWIYLDEGSIIIIVNTIISIGYLIGGMKCIWTCIWESSSKSYGSLDKYLIVVPCGTCVQPLCSLSRIAATSFCSSSIAFFKLIVSNPFFLFYYEYRFYLGIKDKICRLKPSTTRILCSGNNGPSNECIASLFLAYNGSAKHCQLVTSA